MKYLKKVQYGIINYCTWSSRKIVNLIPQDVSQEFKKSFDSIIDNVCKNKSYLDFTGIKDVILQISNYNAHIGKNPSSTIMLHAYNNLEDPKILSSETMKRAFVLAWSIEMLLSHRMLSTGYESQVEAPFWNIQENNMNPVNQANFLRCILYELLTYYFKGEFQAEILQLFNKAFISSAILEYLAKEKRKSIHFNWKQYETMCEYETACITFEVPLVLAIKLAAKDNKLLQDHIHTISLDLGKLYQIQVEYDDCFGDDSYRTSGTHIQEGKCTWLAVAALQQCSAAQRVVLNACYGSNEPAHVERIKYLYEQLKIPDLYREQIGTLIESITGRAGILNSEGISSKTFFDLLDALCSKK